MIPLPFNLRVNVETNLKNSPYICCSRDVAYQVTDTRITNNNGVGGNTQGLDEDDMKVLPSIEEERKRYCIPFLGRCIDRWIPGYGSRVSRLAAELLFNHLEDKYGREIAMASTQEEDWDEVQRDIRVRHVRSIKSRAEKMHIDKELLRLDKEGAEEEVSLDQVVKHANWSPTIEVHRSVLDDLDAQNVHAFDEEKIKDKLRRNTSANEEQIALVVDGVKARILHSDAINLVIANEKLDRIFIQEVAKNKIPLKSLSSASFGVTKKV